MTTNRETEIKVRIKTCASCLGFASGILTELDGVSEVEVRSSEARILVRHDVGQISEWQLIVALREAGYDASPGNPDRRSVS